MDAAAIARWRMRNQRLAAPHAASAARAVDALLAVQGENPGPAAWALAARTSAARAGELAALLSSGELVRTHVLRPTWHFVTGADIDWLLALTGPRLFTAVGARLLGDDGLATADLDRLDAVVLDTLAQTPDRTRVEVAAAVRAQVPALAERATSQLVTRLLMHLELRRLVISGVPREGEHTYAIYEHRVGSRVPLEAFDREAALTRIATRYFTGHGPATVRDLAYWATLPLADVRRGLAGARERLDSFEHEGRTFWHAPGGPPEEPGRPRGHLLQLMDETYRGYQDSRWVLDAAGVVPRGREGTLGIALVDGQLVAGVKRRPVKSRIVLEVTPYRPLVPGEWRALEEAAALYGEFLGRPAAIQRGTPESI